MKYIKKYYGFIIMFLLLASFAFLFFPCGGFVADNEIVLKVSGLQMIFGKKEGSYLLLSFSLLGFMMLVLLSITIILPFIKNIIGKYYIYIELSLIFICSLLYYLLPLIVNHQVMYVSNNFQGLVFLYIGASIMLSSIVVILLLESALNKKK